MNIRYFLIVLLCLLNAANAKAQLKDILVETYYISGPADTLDFAKMKLPLGSVTYRIYALLDDSVELVSVYADSAHPLRIESTENFFNHKYATKELGINFSSDLLKAFKEKSTYHLDSWLSIGFATDFHLGAPKNLDPDSSIYSNKLITNTDLQAGIPLYEKDGLVKTDTSFLKKFSVSNVNQVLTPFSFDSIGKVFSSTLPVVNARNLKSDLTYSGLSVPFKENYILVGQITTHGELSFNLNLELFDPNAATGNNRFVYVSKDTLTGIQGNGDKKATYLYSNLLSYPKKAGCTNPYYTCFDPEAVLDNGSCSSCDSIVLGCMDPTACNYESELARGVNFPLVQLCCYGPDNCGGRAIEKVCPDYMKTGIEVNVYPIPANTILKYEISGNSSNSNVNLKIYNSYGSQLHNTKQPNNAGSGSVELAGFEAGLYILEVTTEEGYTDRKQFIKTR